ncbi:hypothetical protein EW146_g2467 [Bondarzewia mesenterica]|uniref:Aminoglycoside phosphotransferase domain-containing protein n=1 Tax=Bondarzewia mesenterica TaxID=1095465 RepID=A0A4S4M0T0_9AGAM|nr:hypothetical protein EW146_g2467 [Bondarzewia mesenterica]
MTNVNQSKKIGGEIGEVRAAINLERLNAYLTEKVPSIKAPVEVKQFKFGQSNPTYFLTDARGNRSVLRKKPAGQLLSKTAHQIEREYIVLRAIHKHNTNPSTSPSQRVPVPEPIILCEENAVIGTPFYIMEFLDGRIFTDVGMLEVPPDDRRECWLSAVRALAALSSLEPVAIGLSNFGPSTDYFPRQIKSLTAISIAQSEAVDIESHKPTGKIPQFDDMIQWYRRNLPDERKTGLRIVHGDYKLDNMVFHPTENRVIGILDWELCTLGSPVSPNCRLSIYLRAHLFIFYWLRQLADLANMTIPWSIDLSKVPGGDSVTQFSLLRGFKNTTKDVPIPLEDLEREYCHLTNQPYPIKEMVFVRSWMLFRLAIISQGIAARYARRQASSEKAFIQGQMFPVIGGLARAVLEDAGESIGTLSKL